MITNLATSPNYSLKKVLQVWDCKVPYFNSNLFLFLIRAPWLEPIQIHTPLFQGGEYFVGKTQWWELVNTNVVYVSVNSFVYTPCKSFTLTQCQCQYLSNTHTWPRVNVLGHVSVNTKMICKITLSSGLLSSKPFFQGYLYKQGNFIKSGNEMLKISI
jgi:hypothetical protein